MTLVQQLMNTSNSIKVVPIIKYIINNGKKQIARYTL